MDGRKAPRPPGLMLLRRCEAGRLQSQLMSLAYQRICPQVRTRVSPSASQGARGPVRAVDGERDSSPAARAAAGA